MYLFFFGQPTLYTWSNDDSGSGYNSKIVANITESGLNWFTADLTGDSHIWLKDQTDNPEKIGYENTSDNTPNWYTHDIL